MESSSIEKEKKYKQKLFITKSHKQCMCKNIVKIKISLKLNAMQID